MPNLAGRNSLQLSIGISLLLIAASWLSMLYYSKANWEYVYEACRSEQHRLAVVDVGLAERIETTAAGSLASGQKVCGVLQGSVWRDGLIVPKNWPITLCGDYATKTSGTGYQLGCMYGDGSHFGGKNGSLPSPNCGWW